MDAVSSQQQQHKVQRGEKAAENVRYGQKISEEGMGGRTTEAGGNANQGKGGLYMMVFNDCGNTKTYFQTDSERQMHRKEQTALNVPGRNRAMGQDLALGRNLSTESVVLSFTLVRTLGRCGSVRKCSRQSPWR